MKKENAILSIFFICGLLAGLGWGVKQKQSGGLNQNGKVGMETVEKKKKNIKEKEREENTGQLENEKDSSKAEKKADGKEKRVLHDYPEEDYSNVENQLYSWWFKRNDNHEPSGCQEDFDITKWGAYYTVPTKEKKIFLTFDCGYENGYTEDMLNVLKEQQVPAAFFVTQTYIRDNIDLVKRMKEEGHFVCNHTVHHPTMPNISIEEQKKEILSCL